MAHCEELTMPAPVLCEECYKHVWRGCGAFRCGQPSHHTVTTLENEISMLDHKVAELERSLLYAEGTVRVSQAEPTKVSSLQRYDVD